MQRMKRAPITRKVRVSRKAVADDEEAWPVEIEALKNIQEGAVKMEMQSADELIAELKELENEP